MSKHEKESPIVYDYWLDNRSNMIYAILEFKNKETDNKHLNVYLITKEHNGK